MDINKIYINMLSNIISKEFEIPLLSSDETIGSKISNITLQRYWTQPVTKKTIFIGQVNEKGFVIRKIPEARSDMAYTAAGQFTGRGTIKIIVVPGSAVNTPTMIFPFAIIAAFLIYDPTPPVCYFIAFLGLLGVYYCIQGIRNYSYSCKSDLAMIEKQTDSPLQSDSNEPEQQ